MTDDRARRDAARGTPTLRPLSTLGGATPDALASVRTVTSASGRAITRSGISIDKGLAMKAGIHTEPSW